MNGEQRSARRCRIKFCGITTLDDAVAAASAGADYLGYNFVPASRRYLQPNAAQALCRQADERLAGDVLSVGVFQDATADAVVEALESCRLDVLQFHGAESAAYCAQFGKPYWKVIAMTGPDAFPAAAAAYPDAAALMLDAVSVAADGSSVSGGTGERFDARWWPQSAAAPLVLAGGLDADNVAAAVAMLQPWCVDVASGVARAGGEGAGVLKDAELMNRFCREVRSGGR
ncbi:MAG: phosphoribosylanthranilate isomerase [Planctomycetota bacterium]